VEKALAESNKVINLDLAHVSEIDSGSADAIKNTLNFVQKSNRDAIILNANVSNGCMGQCKCVLPLIFFNDELHIYHFRNLEI